jgi:hypothetical protein
MIPPSLWRLPNFTVLMVFSLVTVTWWGTNFIVFIEQFHLAYGETALETCGEADISTGCTHG